MYLHPIQSSNEIAYIFKNCWGFYLLQTVMKDLKLSRRHSQPKQRQSVPAKTIVNCPGEWIHQQDQNKFCLNPNWKNGYLKQFHPRHLTSTLIKHYWNNWGTCQIAFQSGIKTACNPHVYSSVAPQEMTCQRWFYPRCLPWYHWKSVTSTTSIWCKRMTVTPKKNGNQLRTVNLQQLNNATFL